MCSGCLKLCLSAVVLQEGVCAFWHPTGGRGWCLGSLVVLGRVQQDVRWRRIIIHSPLRQPAVGVRVHGLVHVALPCPGCTASLFGSMGKAAARCLCSSALSSREGLGSCKQIPCLAFIAAWCSCFGVRSAATDPKPLAQLHCALVAERMRSAGGLHFCNSPSRQDPSLQQSRVGKSHGAPADLGQLPATNATHCPKLVLPSRSWFGRPTIGGKYCLGERKRYRSCNTDVSTAGLRERSSSGLAGLCRWGRQALCHSKGGGDEPSLPGCGALCAAVGPMGGGSWVGTSRAVPAAIPQWGRPSRTMHACTGCELAQRAAGRYVPAGLRHPEGARKDNEAKEIEASSTDMTAIASRMLHVRAWSGESGSQNVV